jgi:hypothetical protein
MVLNATFINISVTYISWQSILLEDETGIAGKTTILVIFRGNVCTTIFYIEMHIVFITSYVTSAYHH